MEENGFTHLGDVAASICQELAARLDERKSGEANRPLAAVAGSGRTTPELNREMADALRMQYPGVRRRA